MMRKLSFIEKALKDLKEKGLTTSTASETEPVQESKFMVSRLLSSMSTEILKALCQHIKVDRKIVCCTLVL